MKYFHLMFLLVGCSLRMIGAEQAQGDTGITLDSALSLVIGGLIKRTPIEIYEGLPHPLWERGLFEREKKTGECREVVDQWFYTKPQTLTEEDTTELKRLLRAGLLQPWSGPKRCGGFHADYRVTIMAGETAVHVLFCLGCHEVKLVGTAPPSVTDGTTLNFQRTTDVNAEQFKMWTTRLNACRKLRPIGMSEESVR